MIYIILFFISIFNFKCYFIQPKISILVPIYNVNRYLRKCLDSIVNQTLKNIEIICINDGSTDNSLEILMEYIFDNRILVINKSNSGYGDSMNKGLEFVSGKYIGIVESDDFVDINMFEFLYKFTENGDIDMIRSDYYLYYNENEIKPINFNIIESGYDNIFNPIEFPNIFLIIINIWTEIYKKELIINNKIKFLSTPGASYQDISFFFKTIFKSNKIFYINKPFYYYRQTNPNSSVKDNKLNKVIAIFKEFHNIEKFFHKDFERFEKIKKYYNTKKIINLLNNMLRVENKKEYIKLLYQEIYEILKNNIYLPFFNKYESLFLNNLIEYGNEITSDIYINTLSNNISYPKISIIIPIYNSDQFIENSLKSLMKQTFKNFEIICINDGSNNDTVKKLNKFEKLDDRIHIILQKNIEPVIVRNIGINLSKGEYLMFLNLYDEFQDTMIEKLFAKIYGNNNEIVLYNSNNLFFHNYKGVQNKNFFISKEVLNKKSFSFLNIKEEFFNLFIWWPWDKIFKKAFIKDLNINYQNLKTSQDLYFVNVAVILAKNLSFIEESLITHHINNSIYNSYYKNCDYIYYSLKELKIFMKEKGLYKILKQDFINYVAKFSIWNLETIYENHFCELFKSLKNKWFKEFGITKYNKKYFYDKEIYKKIKNIIEFDLKNIKNNETTNDNFFHLKKLLCLSKINISYKIYNKFKLKILYLISSNIIFN